jgi:7,8-dihydroneopterin aldolase/epimerase/oxygenase
MPDKIIIRDLEVDTQIGVTAEERSRAQRLLISVEMERDLATAGRNDVESATTGYDVVTELIRQVVNERPRKLIEAVAEVIAEAILTRRLAVAVTVEVKKFSIPRSRYVAVEIRREQ